jgi:acyl carrier protein
MDKAKIQATILRLLGKIAPETGSLHLNPKVPLRDQFDFDSVDFVNLAIALQEELQVKIPETDYPKLATLNSCIEYLLSKLNQ